jgi:hypothetical protein
MGQGTSELETTQTYVLIRRVYAGLRVRPWRTTLHLVGRIPSIPFASPFALVGCFPKD